MKPFIAFVIIVFSAQAYAFDIDFSRRQKKPVSQSANAETDAPLADETATRQPAVAAPPLAAPPVAKQETIDSGKVVPASDPAADAVTEQESQSYVKNAADSKSPPSRLSDFVRHVVSPVASADRQEFVILNTAKGFVPSNVRLKKGFHYTVHVVNVNDDKKNVSFMLDAFQQHHATYFGKIKTFEIDPGKEGIFEFQCPETAALGKIVVFGEPLKNDRHVSSTP